VLVGVLLIPSQQTFRNYSLADDTVLLDQNWDADIRQQFHYISFGSRIMPYDLFMGLELADGSGLVSDPKVLDRMGFIAQQPAKNNPGGLPVGFSGDKSDAGEWVGLTCAACHTGMLTYQGRKIVVDGGAGMLDFNQFEVTIYRALDAALMQKEMFDKLVNRMGLIHNQDIDNLRAVLSERVSFFENRLNVNKVSVPYGHGRLDAFGRIFNAVTATALDMPNNNHEPNAPVSIPMLWDASHLDLVQWNASAPNKNPGPLGQNVTTALAVYSQIDIRPGIFGYRSTVDIANLGYVQNRLYMLKSPKWPESIFGALVTDQVQKGEALYRDNCIECHSVVDRSGEKGPIKAKIVSVEEVKTDPTMAKNFATFNSSTGRLEGVKRGILAGQPFGTEAQTIDIVVNATIGAIMRKPLSSLSAIIAEDNPVNDAKIDLQRQAYKARSLNGVWATGPFLHNGSVPTLFDLLQAPENRPKEFYVGSKEFDPMKVGQVHFEEEHSSFFDTKLPGNSNRGHNYGTQLSEEDKWSLVEYMKSL